MSDGNTFRLRRAAGTRWAVKSRSYSAPVITTRVDRQVWATAMKLAGHDRGRIVVLGPTAVLVRNETRTVRKRARS